MPYLETPRELAEHIADLCGIYGCGPEEGDHPDDCKCRICFVVEMQSRILVSVQNAAKVT